MTGVVLSLGWLVEQVLDGDTGVLEMSCLSLGTSLGGVDSFDLGLAESLDEEAAIRRRSGALTRGSRAPRTFVDYMTLCSFRRALSILFFYTGLTHGSPGSTTTFLVEICQAQFRLGFLIQLTS